MNLKVGTTFQYDNQLYLVLEWQHSKLARSQAKTKIKVRNLRTNDFTHLTFSNFSKVSIVTIGVKMLQFLYYDNESFNFLNEETSEILTFSNTYFKKELFKPLLKEFLDLPKDTLIKTYFFDEELLSFEFPKIGNIAKHQTKNP